MRKHSGFTLIELLVAISIIGIYSSFLIINFRGQGQQRELKAQALLVLDGIKKVQTMALSGAKVSDNNPAVYSFKIKPCSSNCFFELSADNQNFEQVNLKNASIDIPLDLQINFQPPRGKMEILGGADEATIKLINSTDNSCVYANAVSGRLEVRNCN